MSQTTAAPVKKLYYVSARDGDRVAILLGPFQSHRRAKANVDLGRNLAGDVDPWAVFYAFGTCSAPANHPLRVRFSKAGVR